MVGDIVGKPGRQIVQRELPRLRKRHRADLVITNAENVAGGSGITRSHYQQILKAGADGITLGDHAYRQKDILPVLQSEANICRPANLPDEAVGRRWMKLTAANGVELYVVTVLGRIFMNSLFADDPFATVDRLLDDLPGCARVLVEVHAEATSEKVAMGHYLDGRVAAVVGTHTHIPTADAHVLPGGTAYISDLGMTGPYDSVLGRRKDRVLQFMTTAMPAPFDVASGDVRLCGVLIEINDAGRAIGCQRIEVRDEE